MKFPQRKVPSQYQEEKNILITRAWKLMLKCTCPNRPSKINPGTSLVVQWLRICLPKQETRVQPLVWEDSTCCEEVSQNAETTEPVP